MNKLLCSVATVAVVVAAGTRTSRADEPSASARTVTVVPGAHYEAGWFHRLFLGGHWREAWDTPIEVPVLDLDKFDGGLTPDRQGGGNETFSLRFKSANGRTWVFRSVDKDPKRKLDPETARGWIGALTQDLISGAYPCASLMVPPLLQAVGVLHSTPQLVVMPDDARLGEFRAEFARMLGAIEERIEHRIPGVTKVEDSIDLFQRLENRSDEHVDARDYLRARLIDMLVGDWDRHEDQYRWVRFEEPEGRVWRVVPRDRDEAFSRFDGAIPSIIEYYGKPITGWGDTYPPIDKITFAGRYTDRRFLVSLERTEWDAVTADVVAKLTDAVISEAVHRLPLSLYAQRGEEFERELRSRRDRLTQASKDFYRLLAHDVDLRGTTGADDFQVERQPGGLVSVAIRARNEKSGQTETDPYFRRTFTPDETSEIRLYTMGGKDRVFVQGSGSGSILLRVVSPPGTSEIADRSAAPSALKLYAPPAQQLAALSNPFNPAQDEEADPPDELRTRYEVFRDWGRDYLFFPQLSYDSTRGFLIGTLLQRTGYGFGLDPYASQMRFGAAWATRLSRPRLDYGAELRTRSPVRVLIYAGYSGIEQAKFYGFGNDSIYDSNLASNHFYDAIQDQIIVNPEIEVPLFGGLRARTGVLFKHASSVESNGRFIGTLQPRPEGFGGMSVGSVEAGLVYGGSSGFYPLTRRFAAQVTVREAPSIFSNPSAFGKVRGEVSALYGAHVLTNVVLSVHASGERTWGTYPFFEAAYLGGVATRSPLDPTGVTAGNLLRGYDTNRFAGDAAVVANTDLNIELGRWSTFLPLRYGVFGLFDIGRVFVDGESSSKWHNGAGGGVWFLLYTKSPFLQLAASFRAALVNTQDGLSFYFSSGFGL